jgi:sugar phosphate isomerase/epimerase
LRIGAALIPLVGWGLDVREREAARSLHLGAIRRLVQGLGLAAVELNGDFTLLYPDVFDREYYEHVAALQEELGFACAVHMPFLWLDGLSLAEPVREATMQCMAEMLDLTERVCVESYVLHLWGVWSSLLSTVQQMPVEEQRRLQDEMLHKASLTLEQLGEMISRDKICVENLEGFPFEGILPLVKREGMRVCLDVGHLTKDGGDALEFLDRHWELLGEVHLHDAVPGGGHSPGMRDHLPLGQGTVDYVGFMERLSKGGYEGVVILEVNTEAALLESIGRVEPWL